MTFILHSKEFLEEFNKSFGSSSLGNLFWYILLFILVSILAILAGRRIGRQFLVDHESRHLFNELCMAHGLRSRERRFLWNYADALGLENRCMLFMQKSLFERDYAHVVKERGLTAHILLRRGLYKTMRENLKLKLFADKHEKHELRRQTDKPDKTA